MKKIFKFAVLLFVAFSITSCSLTVKTIIGLKSPKVQTNKRITKAKEKLNFSSDNGHDALYIKQETDSLYYNIMLSSLDGELYFFDENGNRKCYAGLEACVADQFEGLQEEFQNQVGDCEVPETEYAFRFQHLDDFLNQIVDYEGNPISKENLPEADYYFVHHWSKFAGRNKQKREEYEWMIEHLDQLGISYQIIRVNSDLRTDWGMKKGKKVPLHFKVNKQDDGTMNAELDLGDLPEIQT
ncbi:MAG: hypothetical protein ACQESK_10775 [Bacteroidota bacterium]